VHSRKIEDRNRSAILVGRKATPLRKGNGGRLLRELAGERWPEISEQAPNRIRYVGRRRDTGPGASHDQRDSAASNGGLNGGPANWPVLCLVTEI
jgi:hypothetical protein